MAKPQPQANLNDRVYELLRQRVLTRHPGPGAKLSLHELAAELGVSRSPVHHALTRLVSEGLLSVKARRGYFVAPVTATHLVDGYEVRRALELHAAAKALQHPDQALLARLRALLEQSEQAISHSDWDTANAAFHECQVDMAGNALLSRVYRQLSVNLMMQVIRGGKLEGSEHLAREHRAIVEAFEADDLPAAEAAITAHIASGKRIALDAVTSAGGVL